MTYLLSIPALYATDPSCLPTIFGPDGSFPDAPNFHGPVLIEGYGYVAVACAPTPAEPYWDRMVLDLRMPTVAARLLKVCWTRRRSGLGRTDIIADLQTWLIVDWTDGRAAELAALASEMLPERCSGPRSA